ncbi:MAG TPA: class I SAM-dependent methyltransferase, partial [Saprospiraceae bacterium]|nr:class I SAM-dependent methyltransferase [Saprospiraceae bacterium]
FIIHHSSFIIHHSSFIIQMNNLYAGLAEVYEAMYQTFINYEEEFLFYSRLLEGAPGHSMVEIGCGSGHLASRFEQEGFAYTGLDLSADMLAIAQKKSPESAFLEADMRHFDLPGPVSGAIMTGRTISYLLHNRDVYDCFASVRRNLTPDGLFCFDFIDAARFLPRMQPEQKIVHRAAHDGRHFFRESFWNPNLEYGWGFDWKSTYFEEKDGVSHLIGEDRSTIRSFTRDEIFLYLQLAGFEVLQCIDRPSYAFETYVVVARGC